MYKPEFTFFSIAIAFLSAVTINRGIYLYHKDEYESIENERKHLNYSNNSERDAINDKKKDMRIKVFKFQLIGSIVMMIGASFINNSIVKNGLIIGGVINIIYSSLMSWIYLEEAEKFGISILGLIMLIGLVMTRYSLN